MNRERSESSGMGRWVWPGLGVSGWRQKMVDVRGSGSRLTTTQVLVWAALLEVRAASSCSWRS